MKYSSFIDAQLTPPQAMAIGRIGRIYVCTVCNNSTF